MQLINSSGTIPNYPAPLAVPGGTPGYFNQVTSTNTVPTVVSADFLNMLQLELANVVTGAGATLSATTTNQVLLAIQSLIAASARTKLTAALTLYVSPAGNDANAGTALGAPFLTLQAAYTAATTRYDSQGYGITIQLAAGTYTEGLIANLPFGVAPNISIVGNTTTPTSVIVNVGASNNAAITASNQAIISCYGFTVEGTGTAGAFTNQGVGLYAGSGGQLYFNQMNFGACGSAHMLAAQSGIISIISSASASAPYTISGGSASHTLASIGSLINLIGSVVTLTGTPAFSNAFAVAENGGYVGYNLSAFVGSATGSRYNSSTNGIVYTGGGGASYLPGSTAGTTSNGGAYY